jgi:hypothetical protein
VTLLLLLREFTDSDLCLEIGLPFFFHGVRLSPLGTAATTGLLYQPQMIDRWWWLWSNRWNDNWQGKSKYSEKTCPSATLSTTNPTWPDPGSTPGRRCGKPATNHLSYVAAFGLPNVSIRYNPTVPRGTCCNITSSEAGTASIRILSGSFVNDCNIRNCTHWATGNIFTYIVSKWSIDNWSGLWNR